MRNIRLITLMNIGQLYFHFYYFVSVLIVLCIYPHNRQAYHNPRRLLLPAMHSKQLLRQGWQGEEDRVQAVL
jgi:hypothetical protein